jgi:hypothetical protein
MKDDELMELVFEMGDEHCELTYNNINHIVDIISMSSIQTQHKQTKRTIFITAEGLTATPSKYFGSSFHGDSLRRASSLTGSKVYRASAALLLLLLLPEGSLAEPSPAACADGLVPNPTSDDIIGYEYGARRVVW